MTHVCAWCGSKIREIPGESEDSHGICPDCLMEQEYTRGWNDALAEVRRRVGGLDREWGGAPRIPMRATEKPQEASEEVTEGYCPGEQD